jgi:hypothetical protein
MAAVFAGIQVEELDETKRYDPRTGDTRIRHWQGEPTQIALIETQARGLKYRFYTGWNGGYKTISVEYPESDENDPSTPLSEKWECDSNYLQKDLWSLPVVQTELAKIGFGRQDVRQYFKKDFENYVAGNPHGETEDGIEYDIIWSGTTAHSLVTVMQEYGVEVSVFEKLYEDLTKGVSTYEIEQYVVRHTQVTNKSSNIKAARANVGKIHTAEYITSRLPEDVKFEAPETGYWLKRIPHVDQIEKGKWEIVQEWWHADSYSTLIYPDNPIAA